MSNIAKINSPAPVPFEHQVRLAESFAKSGLFGIKSADQALALMALCEAEGMHPAIAVRDYHIIQGKPALKADAMMARFQAAGGKVEWQEIGDERVCATFSHPSGGSATIDWDKQRAITAGFWGKDNWKKFPRAMLRSRVVSEGIRTVFPGVVVGVYTPEEVQDLDDPNPGQPPQGRPIPAKPSYTDEQFTEKMPAWRDIVESGQKNADELITFLSSRVKLTDEQIEQIRALENAEEQEGAE